MQWAEHWGWLNVVPKGATKSRIQISPNQEMPPLERGEYLHEWFRDLGPSRSGGFGPEPTGWSEMRQWSELSGAQVSSWEARLLRGMCLAYVQSLRESESPTSPPPWSPADAVEIDQVRAVMGRLGAK